MVLRKLAHHLELKRVNANKGDVKIEKREGMRFVEARQTARKANATKLREQSVSLLNRVDLDKRLVFPCENETRLRPDIVMFSTVKKLLVMIELTVPWESRIDEAYERKKLKYSDLCDSCREKGWSVLCYPVEVWCRGFVGISTIRALR